jgi:hypothetical protein
MSANQICRTSTDELPKKGEVPAWNEGRFLAMREIWGVEWIRTGADKDKCRTKVRG